ncbi:hypothetical protein CYMTET_6781, partial [Cymbomonas tetramitiformis]
MSAPTSAVNLFLNRSFEREYSVSAADQHRKILERCEGILRELLVTRAYRSEAQLWLKTTIGRLPLSARTQQQQLMKLVPKPSADKKTMDATHAFVKQLLFMTCERKAKQVAKVLLPDKRLWAQFFRESPLRVIAFFEHFNMAGEFHHGAKALARYSFQNRDAVWKELEWIGKHPQAPVTVAAKPHYFCELNVLRTVHNFVERVPEFWGSAEFIDELKSGDIIRMDIPFFARELAYILMEGECRSDSELIIDAIGDFLGEASWQELCQKLLPTLEWPEMARLVDCLMPHSTLPKPTSRPGATEMGDASGILDSLAFAGMAAELARQAAELARVKHNFGRHPARRVEPWEFELLDSKFPTCRQEQCGLEELPEGKKPSGSDGEDSESEEKKRAAAKARFGSLRTATDEELRRALDGSLAVKDITRPPEGEIVVEPEEERADGVTMASGDQEPEPAGEACEMQVPLMSERAHLLAEALKDWPDVAFLVRAEAQEMMDLMIEFVTMLGFKAVGVDAGEELLEELAVAVERYQDGAYAESTQRSYDTGVKAFLTFCEEAPLFQVEGRGKRGALVPMAHAAPVAGLKSLAVQVGLDPAR